MFFWPCRRRRQGQQIMIFMNMCGFSALVPQAPKKTICQQNTSGSLWFVQGMRTERSRNRRPEAGDHFGHTQG